MLNKHGDSNMNITDDINDQSAIHKIPKIIIEKNKLHLDECESPNRRVYYKITNDCMLKVFSPKKSLLSSMNSQSDGYLPPKIKDAPEYTLVLDLDETLIHFVDEVEKEDLLKNISGLESKLSTKQIHRIVSEGTEEYFHVRPFAAKLLFELSQNYEIVIFTAGTQDYADAILDELHCSDCISHRLYRHHTINEDDVYIKDLGLIGRPIEKTIIVDNTEDNFMYHVDNGIAVHSWYDEDTDQVLYDLIKILNKVVSSKPHDIRTELKNWRPVLQRYIQNGIKVPDTFYDII